MALDADQIVERRRLRRKVSFWRAAAFVLAALAILVVTGVAGSGLLTGRGAHVARIELSGIITEDREQVRLIERVGKASSATALIVSIDSPGGTTAGSEAIFEAIRKVSAEKPVVAQLGTLATSGGYAAAIAADRIVARRNTITGSIGVLVQWANVTEMMETLGIDFESVKSGPLKAEPNPFEPTDPQARENVREMVLDSYDWFVELVAERRSMDRAAAQRLADGRIMTGRQALEAGLVDELGGEDAARGWLAQEHGIDEDMPLRDWKVAGGWSDFGPGAVAAALARWVGLSGLAAALERVELASGGNLDGLVSVWHPQNLQEQ